MEDSTTRGPDAPGGTPEAPHYLEREFRDLMRDPATVRFLDSGALDGLSYWDLTDPDQEWMSPGFWRTLGFDPATKRHLASEWQDLIYPEDRDLALENFQRHLADPAHPYDQFVRYRTADGSTVTVRCRGLAIREGGVPTRMLGAHTVVHDTRRHEVDRQLSELPELSGDAILAWSPRDGVARWNRGAVQLYGIARDDALGADPNALTGAEWPRGWDAVERTLVEHGQWEGDVRRRGANGEIFTSTRLQRLEGRAGGDALIMQIDRDVTAQHLAEAELLQSRSDMRQMLDGVAVLIGVLEPDGRVRAVNRTAHGAADTTHDDVAGVPFPDTPWWRVGKEWRDRLRAMMNDAAAGNLPRADMPWSTADGSQRWVDFQIAPVTDEDGTVTALIPSGVDITERKASEAQREVMTAELNHRVKNNLAVVRSMAIQTFGRDDPRAQVFGARLEALGAAHNILTRSAWVEADLHELIEETLTVCQEGRKRIIMDSPPIRLRPQPATSYALAFHELCTNAIKHGALSNDDGVVHVGWRIDGENEDELEIVWSEHDGPSVPEPSRRGFGTRMVSRILASDIQGRVDMDFRPEGLRVTMRAPLAAVTVP